MDIKPIYLFYGEETFLLNKDVAYFKNYFEKEGVIVENFDGEKDTLAEVINAAAEMPLFGGKRLILVYRAPWFAKKVKKGEDEVDVPEPDYSVLTDYAAAPNEETCLVFISAKADRRMKTVKAIENVGTVREYKFKKSYELPDYIRKYLAQHHKTMAPRAMDLFILTAGENLGVISSELDKLILYIGDAPRIGEEDVAAVVSDSAETSSFLLSDAIGMRRVAKVQEYAAAILADMSYGDYAMLFGYLTNYFRLLLRIKDLTEQGKRESTIAKELKIHSYRVKKGIEAQKNYTMAELIDAMAAMLECDYKVKSGRWDGADGLYATILNIAAQTAAKG